MVGVLSATSVATAWGDSIATGIVKQFKFGVLKRRGDVDINKEIGKKVTKNSLGLKMAKVGRMKGEMRMLQAPPPGISCWVR